MNQKISFFQKYAIYNKEETICYQEIYPQNIHNVDNFLNLSIQKQSYPQFVDNLWIICQHSMDKMLKNAVLQKNEGL